MKNTNWKYIILMIVGLALIIFGVRQAYQAPAKSEDETPKVNSQTNVMKLEEVGLEFEVENELKNLTYRTADLGDFGTAFYFTSEEITGKEKGCEHSSYGGLGSLAVLNKSQWTTTANEAGVTASTSKTFNPLTPDAVTEINEKYIIYNPAGEGCAEDQAKQEIRKNQIAALLTSLVTLSVSK